jgi:GTPase
MNEISIVVCGPVDAGKSSLVGVLTTGELDDGRGKARKNIFNHSHEQESGRTSCISQNIIKYIEKDGYMELLSTKINRKYDPKIVKKINMNCEESPEIQFTYNMNGDKVVSLIDLAGHEKYLKTTVFGITGMFPDKGIVVIGANTGITKLTREHIGIMLYTNIPFMIIITKIDMAPDGIYDDLKKSIKKLFQKNAPHLTPTYIENNTDAYNYTRNQSGNIIPIISVSNKSGHMIDNLHRIIYNIPQRNKFNNIKENGTVIYLDSHFSVMGTGLVVSGTVKDGTVKVKQKMFMGPFNGEMVPITIRSIHNNMREDVGMIGPNVQGCFAIRFLDTVIPRNMIRKGMVIIDNIENWKNNIVTSFVANVKILHHSSALKKGYRPIIHCGPIKQVAELSFIDNDTTSMKTGDNELVRFTFVKHPELIEEKMILFFRDGTTKGVGEVVSIS